MPKLPPKVKAVTLTGMKRNPGDTLLIFSDGSTTRTRLVEFLGWDPKLKEAPRVLVNGKVYANEVPKAQRETWMKLDVKFSGKGKEGPSG